MRRARIRTGHTRPVMIAAAVSADNTNEMTTKTGDGVVETSIERETTGGLHTSVDDYLVNLRVAEQTRSVLQTDTHTNTNNQENQQ